jgi:hypothetical protein
MDVHNTKEAEASLWKRYFQLTPEELRMLILILALALIGLTARYLHLRHQESAPVTPAAASSQR